MLVREAPLMKVGFHVYLMPWFAELGVNANGDEEWCFSKEAAPLVTSRSDICCVFMHPSTLFSRRSTSLSRNSVCIHAKTCCISYRCEMLHIFAFSWAVHQTGTWSSPKSIKVWQQIWVLSISMRLSQEQHKKALHSFTYSSHFNVTFYKYCQILRL